MDAVDGNQRAVPPGRRLGRMRQRGQGKPGQRRQDQGLGGTASVRPVRLLQPEVPSDSNGPKGSKNQIAAPGARAKGESPFIYGRLGAPARTLLDVRINFAAMQQNLLTVPVTIGI
jgi:hypothetical protein